MIGTVRNVGYKFVRPARNNLTAPPDPEPGPADDEPDRGHDPARDGGRNGEAVALPGLR